MKLSNFKESAFYSFIYKILSPIIIKLIEKTAPAAITKLNAVFEKFSQPVIDLLFRCKTKAKETETTLDDFLFNQGVNEIEKFANYLLQKVQQLRA